MWGLSSNVDIHWWNRSLQRLPRGGGNVSGRAWQEEVGYWRVECSWRGTLPLVSSYSSTRFLAAMRCSAFRGHALPPWCFVRDWKQQSHLPVDQDLWNSELKYILSALNWFSQMPITTTKASHSYMKRLRLNKQTNKQAIKTKVHYRYQYIQYLSFSPKDISMRPPSNGTCTLLKGTQILELQVSSLTLQRHSKHQICARLRSRNEHKSRKLFHL